MTDLFKCIVSNYPWMSCQPEIIDKGVSNDSHGLEKSEIYKNFKATVTIKFYVYKYNYIFDMFYISRQTSYMV